MVRRLEERVYYNQFNPATYRRILAELARSAARKMTNLRTKTQRKNIKERRETVNFKGIEIPKELLESMPHTILEKVLVGMSIIVDGRLYKCDMPGEVKDNYLEMKGTRFPLVEMDRIAKLEALDNEFNHDKILAWTSYYFSQCQTETLGEQIIIKTPQLEKTIKETKMLEFVIEKVFPYFMSKSMIQGMITTEEVINNEK
ncbi:hypothetical protein JW756_05250 [Candidatus Woesearchaeota archaeon]|nr:hypothetical protein [Candidatus Woesearchaeota archaeon]